MSPTSTKAALLSRADFLRKTNFYWLAMMDKLLDAGMIYERLSDRVADGVPLPVTRRYAASDWQGQTDPDTDWTEELMRDIRFGVGFPDALFEPPGP